MKALQVIRGQSVANSRSGVLDLCTARCQLGLGVAADKGNTSPTPKAVAHKDQSPHPTGRSLEGGIQDTVDSSPQRHLGSCPSAQDKAFISTRSRITEAPVACMSEL